ncbi:MAG: hypothetical protein KDD43_00065 [Bdellovibrionales bacterium]|nr:hypothetical protein [Bdellovibrionales bacterium]
MAYDPNYKLIKRSIRAKEPVTLIGGDGKPFQYHEPLKEADIFDEKGKLVYKGKTLKEWAVIDKDGKDVKCFRDEQEALDYLLAVRHGKVQLSEELVEVKEEVAKPE